jgi:hypothetical protein
MPSANGITFFSQNDLAPRSVLAAREQALCVDFIRYEWL